MVSTNIRKRFGGILKLNNDNKLSHLTYDVTDGARNTNLCSYIIALEGWRRGLTLKWSSDKVSKKGTHAPGRAFTLSSSDKTYSFYKAKSDKVSDEALRITGNKDESKKRFIENGVPVPMGKRFTKNVTNEVIIDYAKKLGFPVVVKPYNGYQGKGVISNIDNEKYLVRALDHIRGNLSYKDVILEQHIEGNEYRIFVLEDEVIAVLKRIPANVIGDGVHSIKELIDMKNKDRKKNPRLSSSLIKIDFEIQSFLQKTGLTLDSVPEKSKQLYLREKSNVSSGGDPIDVTDEFPSEIKRIAVDAVKSMPNLPHAGVDIIVNSGNVSDQIAVVLEINGNPQIGSQVFPMKGKARDIPSALIDYYFPETREKSICNREIYFNFKKILEPLNSMVAKEITVLPAPDHITHAKKYTITGKVQGVGYRKWIRRKALEAELYGYATNHKNGKVTVVVAGSEEEVNAFKEICKQGPKAATVTEVIEEKWNKPIKIGFEVKGSSKVKNKKTKSVNKKKKLTRIQRLKNLIKRRI